LRSARGPVKLNGSGERARQECRPDRAALASTLHIIGGDGLFNPAKPGAAMVNNRPRQRHPDRDIGFSGSGDFQGQPSGGGNVKRIREYQLFVAVVVVWLRFGQILWAWLHDGVVVRIW
jgi:hypothetical protein